MRPSVRPRSTGATPCPSEAGSRLAGGRSTEGGASPGWSGSPSARRWPRRALLAEDDLRHRGEAPAAELLRPVRREPASLGQGVAPVDRGLTDGRILRLAV